jgi:biopolymer transport protein ExbB
MELNLFETLKSSITMMVLLLCSVIALTFIFERWFFLKRSAANAEHFFRQIQEALQKGGVELALAVCSASLSSLAAVVRAGLETQGGRQASEELMNAMAIEERAKLEKNLNVLGTLGNIAPLIGLFGTVVGIISAFHALAVNGAAGPSVLSAGIAEALFTTAAGLVVAVPSVVFYNFFLRKVGTIMTDIESVSKKVLVTLDGLQRA